MTTITDFDALGRAVADTWRNTKNLDNDPVTDGQKRNADLIGQLSAGASRELIYCRDHGIPANIMLATLAAIFAGEAFNVCNTMTDPNKAAAELMTTFVGYLTDMLTMSEQGMKDGVPGPGGMVFAGAVAVPTKEVPDA